MSGAIETMLALRESVERVSEGLDSNLYADEIQRARAYDKERCPKEKRSLLRHVLKHGTEPVKLLRGFGDRKFKFSQEDLESLVGCYNAIQVLNKVRTKWSPDMKEFPLEKAGELNRDFRVSAIMGNLKKKKVTDAKNNYNGAVKTYFRLPDEIEGFSFLFGELLRSAESVYPQADIYGVPTSEASQRFDVHALKLGELELESAKAFGERRFTYIFGASPVSEEEVVDALKKLNRINGDYFLRESDVSGLNPPRAAQLIHDEAVAAKEQGLFADVKTYRLVQRHMDNPDPVIIGFDHFGNRMPLFYWAGDVDGERK